MPLSQLQLCGEEKHVGGGLRRFPSLWLSTSTPRLLTIPGSSGYDYYYKFDSSRKDSSCAEVILTCRVQGDALVRPRVLWGFRSDELNVPHCSDTSQRCGHQCESIHNRGG